MSKVRYAPYVNKVLFQCFQIRICIKKFQDEKMEAMKEIRGEQNIQKEAYVSISKYKKSQIDYLRSPLRLDYQCASRAIR